MTEHVRSWYAASANPHAPFPRLEGDVRADALVIGGGYTGLSAALNLAERGYDVVLLERRRIGWGASGRNGGQIVTGYNRPMAEIESWVGRDDARRLWELNEASKRLIEDRVARHGIRCDLKWGYLLAALKRRHVAALRDTAAEWRAYGYERARLLGKADTRRLVACERYVGGLLDSGGGQLHPLNYALGLAEAARRAGARIFEDSGVERLDDGRECVARTARGTVAADHVILAGNAYLNPLSRRIDQVVRPTIMPVSTYVVATEPLGYARAAAILPGDLAVADINFVLNYYRLSADKRLLFGGGVSYSRLHRPDMARAMKRALVRVFPSLADVRVDYCWNGDVGITINRTPHFGRVGRNVYFAQGFSGHGVALTGLAGQLMAEAVAGTAERFDVFARLPHNPFPGGRPFRLPALVLAMAWYRMRDWL